MISPHSDLDRTVDDTPECLRRVTDVVDCKDSDTMEGGEFTDLSWRYILECDEFA